jgi:hypothetical protein
MGDVTDLTALLARVEKATGPDRKLDWMIAAQVGEDDERLAGDSPIAITASIDAALALVVKQTPYWWSIFHDAVKEFGKTSKPPTDLPRYILAAFLRAKIAEATPS